MSLCLFRCCLVVLRFLSICVRFLWGSHFLSLKHSSELWLSPVSRCSNLTFWRNYDETPVKFGWNFYGFLWTGAEVSGGQVLIGTKGVPRNAGHKQQLVWPCFSLDSSHVQALILTDVQTPFLGTPVAPLKQVMTFHWQTPLFSGGSTCLA